MKDNRNSRPYYKNNQLLLYREITFVCSDVDTKHTNTLCGQNVDRGRSKKPFMSGVVEGEKEVFRLRPLVLLTGEVQKLLIFILIFLFNSQSSKEILILFILISDILYLFIYLFTAIGFQPCGRGRQTCTKIGKIQHKRINNAQDNTKAQRTQNRKQKYKQNTNIKNYKEHKFSN